MQQNETQRNGDFGKTADIKAGESRVDADSQGKDTEDFDKHPWLTSLFSGGNSTWTGQEATLSDVLKA